MKYLLLMLLLLCLSLSAAAQNGDDEAEPTLPENVMRHVVARMTNYYFKRARHPRTIHFSNKNLKQEWLPKIKNITFELVDKNTGPIDLKAYVFEIFDKKKNTYIIQFGYGDLRCGAGSGPTWILRITSSGIRLWPDGGLWGWGSSCDSF